MTSTHYRRQYNWWRVADARRAPSMVNYENFNRPYHAHPDSDRRAVWYGGFVVTSKIPSSIDKFEIQLLEMFWTRCRHLWLLNFIARFLGHLSFDGWLVCACVFLEMSTIQRQWKNDNPMVRKVSCWQTRSVVSWLFFYLCWICLIKFALCDLASSDIFNKKNQPMSRYRMCALCRILCLFVEIRSNIRFLLINTWWPPRCNLMVALNYHVQ